MADNVPSTMYSSIYGNNCVGCQFTDDNVCIESWSKYVFSFHSFSHCLSSLKLRDATFHSFLFQKRIRCSPPSILFRIFTSFHHAFQLSSQYTVRLSLLISILSHLYLGVVTCCLSRKDRIPLLYCFNVLFVVLQTSLLFNIRQSLWFVVQSYLHKDLCWWIAGSSSSTHSTDALLLWCSASHCSG